MKTIILSIAFTLVSLLSFAGNDKPVKDTVINNVKYSLYVGAKGGRYIIVTSKITGKQYKRYFARKTK